MASDGKKRDKGGTTRANIVQMPGADGGRSVVTYFDKIRVSGLSDEQCAILLSMLNSLKGGVNERLTSKTNILP